MATIESLSASNISDAEATVTALVQERYPHLDLSPGRVVRDLLIRPAAILHALNQANIDELTRASSLLEIEADPALASTEAVDRILSNYLLTRRAGVRVAGTISIRVSAKVVTAIAAGTRFISPSGLEFVTEKPFTAVTSAGLVTADTDRLLVQRDGQYEFVVDVVAADVGTDYAVKVLTAFDIVPRPPRYVSAAAAADFSAGADAETNAELLARLREGITARVPSGRAHLEALLRANFDTLLESSVVGAGDAEMLRDVDNLFGIRRGGKVDVYVRTRRFPLRETLTLSAVKEENNVWRLDLPRSQAAGVYEIDRITPANSETTLTLLSETRSSDSAGLDYVPALSGYAVVYSRFQTLVQRFEYITSDAAGTTADFSVRVVRMPQVDEIQDFLSARETRNPTSDLLVRAPTPCFLTVEIQLTSSVETIDTAAIKQRVANAICDLPAGTSRIHGSAVLYAIRDLLPSGVNVVLPVVFHGVTRLPDGQKIRTSTTNQFDAAASAALGVSGETTGFFCEPDSVIVTLG